MNPMHPPTITSANNKEKDLEGDGPTIEKAKKEEETTIDRNDVAYGFEDAPQIEKNDGLREGVASDLYDDEQKNDLLMVSILIHQKELQMLIE
jgi:hypothetical protein